MKFCQNHWSLTRSKSNLAGRSLKTTRHKTKFPHFITLVYTYLAGEGALLVDVVAILGLNRGLEPETGVAEGLSHPFCSRRW
jgi:hypothetical protein